MRFTAALLFAWAVLPAASLRGGDQAGESADIAKIAALQGEIERSPATAVAPRSMPGKATGSTSAPVSRPVIGVELSWSEKLKDEDLRCLQHFPDLTRLMVNETAFSDAGLKHLAGLKKLTRLELNGTKVTDFGMKQLTQMQQLRVLRTADTPITDAGLAEIGRLKNLRSLMLGGTAISDAGLKDLGDLHHLTFLDVSRTNITNAGLHELGGLKTLKKLYVGRTKVTDIGRKRLRQMLAGTQIFAETPGQNPDLSYDVSVLHPAYTRKHPAVLFDEAHNNLHTTDGTYKVFADLITNDGCRVTPNRQPFTVASLANFDLLVIANACSKERPAKSALSEAECDCVENWVRGGGALLLITDHHPFGIGVQRLGNRFGVDMGLSVTVDRGNSIHGALLFSRAKNQLADHAVMLGRDRSEQVDRVLTFTGQSLKGPPGSVPLLKLADTAVDIAPDEKRTSAAGRTQGVALKCGRGRVVVMGEAAQLTAQIFSGDPAEKVGMNVPGCDNRRMALNILHWLTGLMN